MFDENKWNETEETRTNDEMNTQAGQNTQNSQGRYGQTPNPTAGQAPYGQSQNQGYGSQNPYGPGAYQQNPYNRSPYNGHPQMGNYGQNGGQNMGPNPGQNAGPRMSQNGSQNPGMNRQPKKRTAAKTIAGVTAAALLFGVVSGGTMFGVNRAAEILFPSAVVRETAPQENLGQTETVPAASQNSAAAPASKTGAVLEDVSPIVEAAMPSVVAITNTMLYRNRTWFGETQTFEIPSSGSGIIVDQNDKELLIVTNNHVIEDSDSLAVTFADGKTVEAAVKGTDSESDLAVIAVPLENIESDTRSQIKAATMGDSDALKMGEGVIAIGNALGHGQSVTVGHVSALNREITVDGITKTVIQTDAAINPGNSGGALLNASGELIGINEAKYADTNVEGVGYAIPISYAKDIIEDLKNRTTKVAVSENEQGYLGITVQNIDAVTAQLYGMPEGVYVYKIAEGSAAANSDLREKDIITEFDGERVRTYADLQQLQTYYKAGSTVNLTVQSLENGEYVERNVTITLGERPAEESESQASVN